MADGINILDITRRAPREHEELWAQEWECRCGKTGRLIFTREQGADRFVVYELLNRQHKEASPLCIYKERTLGKLSRWKHCT